MDVLVRHPLEEELVVEGDHTLCNGKVNHVDGKFFHRAKGIQLGLGVGRINGSCEGFHDFPNEDEHARHGDALENGIDEAKDDHTFIATIGELGHRLPKTNASFALEFFQALGLRVLVLVLFDFGFDNLVNGGKFVRCRDTHVDLLVFNLGRTATFERLIDNLCLSTVRI